MSEQETATGDFWLCAGNCGQWCKGMPAAHNGSGPVCHECERPDSVCEKCGSRRVTSIPNEWVGRLDAYDCGTSVNFGPYDRAVTQSYQCRARELEAERDALKEKLEAAEKSCELKIDDMTINVPNFLRCVVRNAARIGRGRRGVAWARVADICGVGSTTAIKLCRAYGMDPDTGKALPANPEAPHAQ